MIILKSPREIALMRAGGRILAEVRERLRAFVKPGISTAEIDREVETFIEEKGAKPAFKGYRGFPATVCTSINEEVVHGIPSPARRLKEGDIIGLDLGCIVDGYYADCAFTLAVGEVPPRVQQLLDVTQESLERGVDQCRPGPRAAASAISRTPSRSTWSGTASRWCGLSSGTASAASSTRIPRSPTSARPAAGPC